MERYSDIMSKLAQIAEALLDPSPLGFFIAIIVVIAIPIVLHNILAGDSSENVLPSILLLGPIGSGKTSLQTLVGLPGLVPFIALEFVGIDSFYSLNVARMQRRIPHRLLSPSSVHCL